VIQDIENVLGQGLDVGGGITKQLADGTWVAAIAIEAGDVGLYGAGASEGHALEALKAKVKAMGLLCSTAFAEAESRHQVRMKAEDKAMADKFRDILSGLKDDKYGLAVETPKKPDGDN
jgi:hypothetical protein